MIMTTVKNSQSEMVNTGYLFQSSFHVDDSIVAGLKAGYFAGIKGDGKIAGLYGTEEVATLKYADAATRPVGVVFKETRASQYESQLEALKKAELKAPEVLLPYGPREDKAIGLLRKGVLEIANTENTKYRHFRTLEVVLDATNAIGTAVTAGNDLPSITVANANVKVGDPVLVGNLKAVVKSVTASAVVLTALEDIAIDTYNIVAPSLIGYPVYLNANQASTDELPFTLVAGTYKVGWVESPIHVRFDLALAL